MSEKSSEKSEMHSAAIVQSALQERIAPPSLGSVKARIRHASRRLGWTASRTKDAWYADPRISISGDELRAVEIASGVRDGKAELRELDTLIARADAILAGQGADSRRPVVDAIRSLLGALAGS